MLPCLPPHRKRKKKKPKTMRPLPGEISNSTFLTKTKMAKGAKIKGLLPFSLALWLSQNQKRTMTWWQVCLNTSHFYKACSEPLVAQHRQEVVEAEPEHFLPSLYWSDSPASAHSALSQQAPDIHRGIHLEPSIKIKIQVWTVCTYFLYLLPDSLTYLWITQSS